MSDLVGNPEDRFSRVAAHINIYYYNRSYITAAGECFCRSAKLQLELGSRHEAATHYVDAGNAYKKADPQGMPKMLVKTFYILKKIYFIRM